MNHEITSLPSYNGRHLWYAAGKSALSRILSHRKSLEQADPELVLESLRTGQWRPIPSDIRADISALLFLMGSYDVKDLDMGASGDITVPVMPLAEQEIAAFLVEAGSSLTAKLPESQGLGDALDMALVLSADMFLETYVDRVDWKSRRMMGLPWLHFAARRGFPSVMKVLMAHGADIELADANGNTALFHASDAASVALLVEAGANASHINQAGKTPLSHWESQRSIKGDRNRQMASALSKAKITLTRDQEIAQFFLVAASAPKGRLEKEVRRLRLTGAERQSGVGQLQLATRRMSANVGNSYNGAQGNNDRNWMEYVGTWEGAISSATHDELMDAFLVANLTDCNLTRKRCEEALQDLDLRHEDEENAWCSSLARVSSSAKSLSGKDIEKMVAMLCSHENPIQRAPLMLDIMGREKSWTNQVEPIISICRAMEANMHAPGWEDPRLLDGLVVECLRESHGNKSVMAAQEELIEFVFHAAQVSGSWTPTVRSALAENKTFKPHQVAFVDKLAAILDACELSGASQTAAPSRRSPRL